MASGKKGKKTKGKTLALTDFLQDTGGSLPSQPIRKSTTSWADEVDEYDGVDARKVVNVVLPTAPKASRDMDDIADKVPKDPPYIAYLSNLPYDVDEEDITEFFGSLRISNMRIPKDERPGEPPKLKGFGYIEFEDRESLMGALVIPDTMLKSRRIRIEVAANAENDRRRGGRMDMNRSDREMSDTSGDWRSSNRPDLPADDRNDRRRGGGGLGAGGFTREGMRDSSNRDGGFSRDRDSGFSRDRDFGRDRDSGFGRNRDREQDDKPGAWRDGDRPNRDDRRPDDRDRGFTRSNFRDSDRDRGRGFDDRDDRRGGDRDDRRGGGFGRRYDDRDDRNGGGMTRSGIRNEERNDRSQDEKSNNSEPRQRPKLNLAPRTKPIETPVVVVKEEVEKKEEEVERRPAPVPAASIFGAAKPVDTAQRERQIEEKLRKEQEERLRDGSKDRKDRSGDEGEKRNTERSRPLTRKDSSGPQESGARDNKNLPPREKRSDDNRRSSQQRDHRSPPPVKSKTDKPEREEKRRERPERDMPKLKEADAPVFSDSNKFAFLQDDEDVSE